MTARAPTSACPLCGSDRLDDVGLDFGDRAYLRCRDCRLLSLQPPPSAEELADLYGAGYFEDARDGEGYSSYEAQRAARSKTFARYARRLARIHPGGRVLDVGCAKGYFLDEAQRAGLEAHGIDVSAAAIDELRPLFGDAVRHGTVEDWARDEGCPPYDALLVSDTIEHVPRPRPFAAALARLLRPGGVLIVVTPDERSWLARLSGRRWVSLKVPEHVVLFNRRTLRRLLEQHFDPIRFRASFQEYPTAMVQRRLRQLSPLLTWPAELLGRGSDMLRVPDGNLLAVAERRSD